MKIKPKQYAMGLFESLVSAGENEQKEIVASFSALLIGNNDISKLEAVLEHFGNMWNKYKDTAETEIISAHELDEKILKSLKKLVSEKAGATNVIIKEHRDKKLLGGVVLKYGDKSLDLSLKRKLDEFKKIMIG